MGWMVSQIGAREHYATAVGLEVYSTLDQLYTDAWCRLPLSSIPKLPGPMVRYAGRADRRIRSVKSYELQLGPSHIRSAVAHRFSRNYAHELRCIEIGRRFDALVRKDLRRRRFDPNKDAFFGYFGGALESLRYLGDQGVPTILDQTGCGRSYYEEVAAERLLWPEWEGRPPTIHEAYFDRAHDEWKAASAVVVNSNWARKSALKEGCSPDKIFVLPLAYDAPSLKVGARPPRPHGRLKVMWLGRVILSKGIQYLLLAAQLLPEVDFIVAGQIGVDANVLRKATPSNVKFLGPIPRSHAAEFLTSGDLFVLPTLSDSFALTQLEAMSAGLPVITTDRCGDVVTDGQNGYIVPVRDPYAIANAVARLDCDRNMLKEFSRLAVIRARQLSLTKYVENLETIRRGICPAPAMRDGSRGSDPFQAATVW